MFINEKLESNLNVAGYTPAQQKIILEMNSSLSEVAKNLAYLVKEPKYRTLIKNQVAKKFDQDYDVLLYHLMKSKLPDGKTFSESVSSNISRTKASENISINNQFTKIISEIPLVQVAIPVNFKEWDPNAYTPKVAFLPVDYDESTTKTIIAYDYSGNEYEIDAIIPPTEPVIVVSLNERVDINNSNEYVFSKTKKSVPENILELLNEDVNYLVPPIDDEFPGGGGGGGTGGGNSSCQSQYPYRINGNYAYLKNIFVSGYLVGKIEGWPAGDLELDIKVFALDKNMNFSQMTEIYSVRNEYLSRHNVQYRWQQSMNLGIVAWNNLTYGQTLLFSFVENDRELFGENTDKEINLSGTFKVTDWFSLTAGLKIKIGNMDEHIGQRTVDQFPVPPQFDNGKCYYDIGSDFSFVLE